MGRARDTRMSDLLKVLAVCHEDVELVLGGMGMHVRELYRAMGHRGDVKIDLLNSGVGEGSQVYKSYHRHFANKLVCWKPNAESMTSVLLQDIQLLKTFQRLMAEGHRWDVVHVHEWNSLQVGWAIRDTLGIPLIGTMHLCLTHLAQGVDGSPHCDFRAANTLLLNKIKSTADLTKDETTTLENKFSAYEVLSQEINSYIMNQEARLVVESDETILCSQAYVDIANKLFLGDGFLEKPIHMIHNGIDLSEWNPQAGNADRAVSKHHLPWNRPLALFVGRISYMKGLIPLLEVLEQEDLGYCVVMAGAVNATTREEADNWVVTKRIKALQLEHPERLRWLDYQAGQDLKDLYACAQVGLMPSTHEPFGIVALEHMAMGVPLISTEVDGLAEVVTDGQRGDDHEFAMIIPPRDPKALSEALRLLKDETKRTFLREQGLKRVQAFSWDVAAQQTVDVYRNAIRRQNKCQ